MKRFILSIFILVLMISPVFADNSEQYSYEQQAISKQPIISIYPATYIIKEDIDGYYNGKKSLYGIILYYIDDYKKQNTPSAKLNLKYLELVKVNYENITHNKPANRIDIDNNDFSKLSDESKTFISSVNILAQNTKTSISKLYRFKQNEISNITNKFNTNKNNMKNNKELINSINSDLNQINKLYEYLLKHPEDIDIQMSAEDLKKEFNEIKSDFNNLSNDIKKYSYSYESTKYNNWAKRNNKKQIVGRLDEPVYDPYFQIKNGLYVWGSQFDYPLQVIQSLPNGVLVSGNYTIGGNNTKTIFLVTSKKYADGQWLREPIVAEYKGLYDYTNIMGVNKRIYKFYRYGKNEIDANFKIPNETLYFYSPY